MRGIELPINVLVIVAIAVIVLLGIVALYLIGWGPFSGGLSILSLKNVGCSNFSINYRCGAGGATTNDIKFSPNSYLPRTINGNLYTNTLLGLCEIYFNTTDGYVDPVKAEADCRALCNCV